MFRTACVTVCVSIAAAAPVSGQAATGPDRVYISVNGGLKATTTAYDSTIHPIDFAEAATVDSRYKATLAPVFDVGGGVRVWRNLAIGAGVSRFSKKGASDVEAQVPHPFYFGRPRAVSGQAPNLRRVETAVHIKARWMLEAVPQWLKPWHVAISGGPSVINVEQDVIEDVTVSQTYPFDTATFSAAVARKRKRAAAGFNIGVDLERMLRPRIGVGASIGFSQARVKFADIGGSDVKANAGGATVSGGLRFNVGGRRSRSSAGRTTAAPRAQPAAAASHRRWEIEGHAGGAFEHDPTAGTSALPPAGQTFTTTVGLPSRRSSSWYFGDGAVLMNAILTAFRTPSGRITSLDAVLNARAASRDRGASFGLRVGRGITDRFGAEFTVDAPHAPLMLSDALLEGVEASRASFIAAWNERTGLLSTGVGVFTNPAVTSVSTISDERGGRVFATGALTMNLLTRGRFVPYVAAGAGMVSNTGGAPSVMLVGNYRFTSLSGATFGTFPVNETDTVHIRVVPAKSKAPVTVFGGGVRIAGSSRWGVRADVRAYVGTNSADVLVDANPQVATGTPAGFIAAGLTPSLQFSNDGSTTRPSTFGGPAITGFRTFTGRGTSRHVAVSAGYFVRF